MVPGSDLRVELIEFRNVDAHPVHPKLQDPGATLITFNVRDVDAVAARAERSGVQMITPGGKPATLEGGKARAIFVKDPSGFYVEVVQRNGPIAATAPQATSSAQGWRSRLKTQTKRCASTGTSSVSSRRAEPSWRTRPSQTLRAFPLPRSTARAQP